MELVHIKGNTYYLRGEEAIPLYRLSDNRCILLDTGTATEEEALDRALADAGLTPVAVLGSHMHMDHHGNTRHLRDKHGLTVALTRGEAEVCRTPLTMKANLFIFTHEFIAREPITANLVCPVDRLIDLNETEVTLFGAKFEIIHTPGHSIEHISIVTPDGVCYVGDCLLSQPLLAHTKMVFVFDMALDLASKRKLKSLPYDTYILAHNGVYTRTEMLAEVEANLTALEGRLAMLESLIDHPMTMGEVFSALYHAVGMRTTHPIKATHQERYPRPYLEYLIEYGNVEVTAKDGMVYYGPKGERHE